jgi:uncharacterized protein YdhG (YjbR/CyaY superfamily)
MPTPTGDPRVPSPLLNPTIGFGCAHNVRSMTAKRSRKRVASVREYVASKPKESRASLEAVRRAILKALPHAQEGLAYQMPAYTLNGVGVLYSAGWKSHYSLYPASDALVEAFAKELAPYERSNKECEFPNSGNLDLDWTRWYRRAVEKSARQLWRAQGWVLNYPSRLFLDASCKHPFPLVLPPTDRMRVHLILVAHGAAERCRSVLGGSGSLMIWPDTIGPGTVPFAVGRVDPSKKYIHILDDTTLDILLGTLDTVADFVAYLQKKEAFVESGKLGSAAGEEELLAFYLADVNDSGEHDFIIKQDVDRVMIDEGHWTGFSRDDQRKRQLEANKVSYAWDALIEHFNKIFSDGRMEHTPETTVINHEKIMRYFARESRAGRRVLAKTLFSLLETTPAHLRRTHVFKASRPGDPYFVFLLVPWRKDRPDEENRRVRRHFLEACCRVTKLVFPEATDIVGFATQTARGEYGSEDALYFDARQWTADDDTHAKELQQKLRILTNAQSGIASEKEYPD